MITTAKVAAALTAVALVGASCGSNHRAAGAGSGGGTTTTAERGGGTATSKPAGGVTSTTEPGGGGTTTTVEPGGGTTTSEPGGGAATVTLQVRPGANVAPFTVSHTLSLPLGWTAEVWARVPDARMEAWTPQGDLLISEPSLGEVVEVVPGATAQVAPTQTDILSGLSEPQGLAFAHLDGQWVLYVGESTRIDRYIWSADGLGQPTLVAANLPDLDPSGDDVHREKDVAVASDGTVYFNVGSSSNANPADRRANPPRGVIMAVDPDGRQLRVVETGVRNGEGLAVAPNGTVWTAVNNRDNVTYPFTGRYGGIVSPLGRVIQSYVNDHPSDEVVPVTQGRDLGWPYCNPDPDLANPKGSTIDVPFVADAVTNPSGGVFNCATLAPIEVGLEAHSAPLGLDFLEGSKLPAAWRAGAVVAVHGSWDRQPPQAPAVLWMPWNSVTETLGRAVTMVGGFQNSDGSRWGRPVDAVPGPDGALYVSDDTAGAIYRLVPPAS